MQRKGIVPKEVYDKAKVMRQLSSKKSFRSENERKEADQHFQELEEKFINQLTDMGYDYTDVKDFIEDKGVPEFNQGIVVSGLSEPSRYKNKLFTP